MQPMSIPIHWDAITGPQPEQAVRVVSHRAVDRAIRPDLIRKRNQWGAPRPILLFLMRDPHTLFSPTSDYIAIEIFGGPMARRHSSKINRSRHAGERPSSQGDALEPESLVNWLETILYPEPPDQALKVRIQRRLIKEWRSRRAAHMIAM